MALDFRGGKARLYIADTGNSRVLAWPERSHRIRRGVRVVITSTPSNLFTIAIKYLGGGRRFRYPYRGVSTGCGNSAVDEH